MVRASRRIGTACEKASCRMNMPSGMITTTSPTQIISTEAIQADSMPTRVEQEFSFCASKRLWTALGPSESQSLMTVPRMKNRTSTTCTTQLKASSVSLRKGCVMNCSVKPGVGGREAMKDEQGQARCQHGKGAYLPC